MKRDKVAPIWINLLRLQYPGLIIPRRRPPNFRVIALCYFLYCPGVTNLLGLYLKDYYIFERETSRVYRSHWGEVHCKGTITLHLLSLEVLPFVIFHTVRASQTCWGYISKTITDLKLQGCIDLIEEKCTAQEP